MRGSHRRISTVVIDTSCLLFLDHLDLVPSLSIRYNKVYVPRFVFQEACRKQRKRYRLRRLIAEHAIRHTLAVRGTLGILKEFRQIRIIQEVAPLVEKLQRDLDYRISSDVLREVLNDLEEL